LFRQPTRLDIRIGAPPSGVADFAEERSIDDMTVSIGNRPTSAWRFGSGDAYSPHVGEYASTGMRCLGMVKQRDGGRVSAAGDER
jgi:hypothetical protein